MNPQMCCVVERFLFPVVGIKWARIKACGPTRAWKALATGLFDYNKNGFECNLSSLSIHLFLDKINESLGTKVELDKNKIIDHRSQFVVNNEHSKDHGINTFTIFFLENYLSHKGYNSSCEGARVYNRSAVGNSRPRQERRDEDDEENLEQMDKF